MTLRHEHPALTQFTCAQCQKHYPRYDWDTGVGDGELLRQPDGTPEERTGSPPCFKCPKESPEKEHEHLLSGANLEVYELYLRLKATCGACLTDDMRQDEFLMELLATTEQIVQGHKDSRHLQAIYSLLR